MICPLCLCDFPNGATGIVTAAGLYHPGCLVIQDARNALVKAARDWRHQRGLANTLMDAVDAYEAAKREAGR